MKTSQKIAASVITAALLMTGTASAKSTTDILAEINTEQRAKAQAAGEAVGLIYENKDLMRDVAQPTEYQITSTCGDNLECREGLKSDAKSLQKALGMLDQVSGRQDFQF